MLRYRCDDGDVVLGIAGVQQGVETSSPGGDLAGSGADSEGSQAGDSSKEGDGAEEDVKLLTGELAAHVVHEGMDLAQAEYTQGLQVNELH